MIPTAKSAPLISSCRGSVSPVRESPSMTTAAVPGAMPMMLATVNGSGRTDDNAEQ